MIVKVENKSYTVEPLYQWDLNQMLEIRGLSMAAVPEVHFTNDALVRAVRRFATMDAAGVIQVEVPNALLQTAAKIRALVCIREGEVFKTYHEIRIPVKPRPRPADYTITDDQDVYSFLALENLVYESATKTAADAEAAAASAAQAVSAAGAAQTTAGEAKNIAAGIAATANAAATAAGEASAAAEAAQQTAEEAKVEAKAYTDTQVKKAAPWNLLDNSYFADPVNQRGANSYSGQGYGIDRWKSWYNENVITVNNGSVACTKQLWQDIEPHKIKPNTPYTFAARQTDGTLLCLCGLSGEETELIDGTKTKLAISFEGDSPAVWLAGGDYVWAALYEGEYTAETLPEYRPKGYGAELAECYRYFRRYAADVETFFLLCGTASSRFYGAMILDIPMRAGGAPTISFNNISGYPFASGESRTISSIVVEGRTKDNSVLYLRGSMDSAVDKSIVNIRILAGGNIDISMDL